VVLNITNNVWLKNLNCLRGNSHNAVASGDVTPHFATASLSDSKIYRSGIPHMRHLAYDVALEKWWSRFRIGA
jgi:hypothetical protein